MIKLCEIMEKFINYGVGKLEMFPNLLFQLGDACEFVHILWNSLLNYPFAQKHEIQQ